jgi:succinate dehydrogenase/fumarate reductase flavoprotein subunit
MTTNQNTIRIEGLDIPVRHVHVLVIGSGAASLACAVQLRRMGCDDLLVATDNLNGGTSLNTGSDKQTYYRLGDSGMAPDSPYAMAESYMTGGSTHGDLALVEAQGSLRAFYNLVSLGVQFPHNRYGGYTGYKTDHDPCSRGISLGPYTSKVMVEQLRAEAVRIGIPLLDRHDAVRLLLSDDHRAAGALFVDKSRLLEPSLGFTVMLADHVVLGTGGPAGFYAASVYPRAHTGSIGLAMELGAEAVNLGESQFGIASTKVRWNLSGSYQQVLPRYFSTDADGNDCEEFLNPYFRTWQELTKAIFLKGYQWPFDAAKVPDGGSSLIDLLVHREIRGRGRRVFLDYSTNPGGNPVWGPFVRTSVDVLALDYLDRSSSWAPSPIERLRLLNPQAIEMYRGKGINLASEVLEIDLCAQHNNGGLAADIWWESTTVKRLYPVGEVNGSHGVSRPGGSALNAGQVGAIRAATRIMGYGPADVLDTGPAIRCAESQCTPVVTMALSWVKRAESAGLTPARAKPMLDAALAELRGCMSRSAGPIRMVSELESSCIHAGQERNRWLSTAAIPRELVPGALRLRHMLIAQHWYLKAVHDYVKQGGGSRGSYLVTDEAGAQAHPLLPEYRIKPEVSRFRTSVQVVGVDTTGELQIRYEPCRPIPQDKFWFERVWSEYRAGSFFAESQPGLPSED